MSKINKQRQYRFIALILTYIILEIAYLIVFTGVSKYFLEMQKAEYKLSLNRSGMLIKASFDDLTHGLQGVNGAYTVNNYQYSSQVFRNYAKSRNFFNNFPSVLGFGFIRNVKNENLKNYELALKKNGYSIRNIDSQYAAQFSEQFIIEVIEPVEKNRPALGLNIGSNLERRQAAVAAAQNNIITITDPIKLVQNKKTESGFLIYLPLFRNAIADKKNLVGFAYAPISISTISDALKSIYDGRVDFEFKTGGNGNSFTLFSTINDKTIYRKNETLNETIEFAGRKWQLVGYPVKTFQDTAVRNTPWLIFILFSLITSSAFFWIYNLYKNKDSEADTAEIKESWNIAVLNSSTYSIIATDPDGKILTFNKAAERMLGYTAEEMVGKTPEIIHDLDEVVNRSKVLTEELGRPVQPGFQTFVIKTETVMEDICEWTYIRKDKSTFPVRLCVSAVKNTKGQLMGYLGIAEDLTEQMTLRTQIDEQRAQMVQSMKMSSLGEMAGGIAHEINNPLAIIQNSSQILMKHLAAGKIETSIFEKNLDKINRTVTRISKIVQSLRKLSRDTNNEEMSATPLENIISETLEFCSERLKAHEVDLTVQVDPDINMRCRPTEISQILLNLLNNSFDAIQNNQIKWIKLNSKTEGGFAVTTITDSGPGIPQEVAEKMLQPFYTTKEVGKGTGLGLSISAGIAKAHGGVLQYNKSSPNTQFVLKIPLA